MDNIEKVLKTAKGNSPYPRGLRVKIVSRRITDNRLHIGVADTTGAMKIICSQDKLFASFQGTKTIRNFTKGYSNVIFTNKNTTLSKSREFEEIPPHYLTQAEKLVYPDESPLVKLDKVEEGQIVSVEAVIVKDEKTQQRGSTEVRNIQLDDGKQMQLALWNAKSTSPVKIGDKVKFTNVKAKYNTHLKQLSLNTTSKTEFEIKDTVKREVIGRILSMDDTDQDFTYEVVLETNEETLDLQVNKSFMGFFFKENSTNIDQILQEDILYCVSLQNSIIMNMVPNPLAVPNSTSKSKAE